MACKGGLMVVSGLSPGQKSQRQSLQEGQTPGFTEQWSKQSRMALALGDVDSKAKADTRRKRMLDGGLEV